jgi:hypothetical protein
VAEHDEDALVGVFVVVDSDLVGGCHTTYDKSALGMVHSTVTLLARLRGLSTSQPRRIAAW